MLWRGLLVSESRREGTPKAPSLNQAGAPADIWGRAGPGGPSTLRAAQPDHKRSQHGLIRRERTDGVRGPHEPRSRRRADVADLLDRFRRLGGRPPLLGNRVAEPGPYAPGRLRRGLWLLRDDPRPPAGSPHRGLREGIL